MLIFNLLIFVAVFLLALNVGMYFYIGTGQAEFVRILSAEGFAKYWSMVFYPAHRKMRCMAWLALLFAMLATIFSLSFFWLIATVLLVSANWWRSSQLTEDGYTYLSPEEFSTVIKPRMCFALASLFFALFAALI